MDAITLLDKPTDSAPVPRPREALRRLWQAPVFVLGVGAVLCFLICQPYLSSLPTLCIERNLKEARAELERPNSDPEEIARRLQSLIDHGVPDSLAGEAHFLYGTAHLRVAENMNGELARDHWDIARDQLEQAEKWSVPESDQLKLQYRLGKVGYYLQSDPAKVVERLAAALDGADDRAEGYNLLSAAYLRLTPPNLEAALDANLQLRQLMAPEEVLARARLSGGEILLRMHNTKEARELLERIGNQAPLAILTQARILRARSKQDENNWAGAATLWQAALADSHDTLPDAGLIRYNLGLCYRRLDLPMSAEPIWEECVHNNSGDESYAAALGLAELYMQEGQGDKARERLEFALHNTDKPEDWDNKLLDRAAACDLVEHCCLTARQTGKFELALQVVEWYKRIGAPGRALIMGGDIATDWAKARQEALKNKPLDSQTAEEAAVRDLFKQAAEAYEHAAKQTTAAREHGDWLWLAASRAIDAGDQVKAQALLDEMFELKPRPDARLGEGWYQLGESFRKEIRPEHLAGGLKWKAAEAAYLSCINYQTPFEYEARYRLAQFKIAQGHIDKAVNELEQILGYLPGEESEIKQRARFTLVDICYGAKKYKTVVQKMEEVLDHLPTTAEATQARFEMADSYRLLADEQDRLLNDGMTYREQGTIDHFKKVRDDWRQRAVEEFDTLRSIIEKPESAEHLNAKTQRDVYYCAAYVLFQMGKYDQSLAAYRLMADRYTGQAGEWTAIAGMVSVYTGLGNDAQVLKGLNAIRAGLPDMDSETKKVMTDFIDHVQNWLNSRPKRQP